MAARADVSIMITAKDNYSEAIMKMQKTQTAFRKDLKAMQKDLDNLNKSKIQLKVDLTQTKKELAEAKRDSSNLAMPNRGRPIWRLK